MGERTGAKRSPNDADALISELRWWVFSPDPLVGSLAQSVQMMGAEPAEAKCGQHGFPCRVFSVDGVGSHTQEVPRSWLCWRPFAPHHCGCACLRLRCSRSTPWTWPASDVLSDTRLGPRRPLSLLPALLRTNTDLARSFGVPRAWLGACLNSAPFAALTREMLPEFQSFSRCERPPSRYQLGAVMGFRQILR